MYKPFNANHKLDMCLWNTDAPGVNKVKLDRVYPNWTNTPRGNQFKFFQK